MKIAALRLYNVKRFAERGVAIENFGDGVNVLCAANEFGKSTSFEALHALFFQPHSSTSGDVRNLKPYSGGSPLVEADISTNRGTFRIAKQYFGSRFARVTHLATGQLLAQADEAENFIADLVKGGTAGPAGLLWVRQGVTGIDKRSKSEEDGEREVRRSLLESVQGEVEAVTGGRRLAEILSASQQALTDLVTPTGRAKAGGRYHAAIEARDRLATDESKLSGEVTLLREALEQRVSASKRLAEIDNEQEREERLGAVEAAQATFDAAKSQNEKLRTAEAELKLAIDRREASERELLSFRRGLDRARSLEQRLQVVREQRRTAETRRRELGEAIARAAADVGTAETVEKEARDLLARLDAALRAREAFDRLEELKDRLAQAEATRKALEEGEARHALISVPGDAIEELQNVEIRIAELQAVEDAGRSTVSVVYEPDAAIDVQMDGRALPAGETRSYEGQTLLSVRGVGTITLRSRLSRQGDGALQEARDRRRAILESLGVEDLRQARTREATAQRLENELEGSRGRLAQLAPEGLPRLREEVAAKDAMDKDALELKADPELVRASQKKAEEALRTARSTHLALEPARNGADDAFIAAETALASVNAELAQVDSVLGPKEARDEAERTLSQQFEGLRQAQLEAQERVDALRDTATDMASVEASLRRARSVVEAAEREISQLKETIAGLAAEIRTRSDDAIEEKWRETSEQLSAANDRVTMLEKEVAVLQRLASALETARSAARDLYLKPVMTELTPLLGLLFDDVSISFDEKSLLPQTIKRNGLDEEIDRLSGGMREQLSVLTRLAFARLLARDGRPAPVILDDALVYSDDDRIEKMFDALHRQSRDLQIIVFSCRQRAFQKLGGHALQMTEWRP